MKTMTDRRGPCHETGGRYHRCDGEPVVVRVHYDRNGYYAERYRSDHTGEYRWCEGAILQAEQAGATVERP